MPWNDDACAGIDAKGSAFASSVARFQAEDDLAAPPSGLLVITGSSSIRRWETASRSLASWGVVQRGIGGSHMRDIAAWAEQLVLRHHPRGVLVFAGTNDIADGVPPDEVVRSWRCRVQKVRGALGRVPVIYIGITPAPSRWSLREENDAVNSEIARLARLHCAGSSMSTCSRWTETRPACR